MSNIATTSPQLRRRKSKMVPHASQKRKDPLPKDTDADENPMELNEFISPSAMADKGDLQVWSNHSLGRTFLDTGDIVVGTQKNGTVDVIDNGHSAEAKPSGDNTCKVNKSDDDDDDGGKESNARPLLSDSENRDGEGIEVEIEEVEVMQVIQQAEDAETLLSIILQVSVPYLIAGFGTVGAGLVLDVVQHKPVFTAVNELFILVPALLGLKGNLEMTLASRLSTQANLGNMDTKREKLKMITGNMALIQAQATVVGFLASMFAMVIGWIPKGEFPMEHALLLCASSLFTAAVASFVLGGLMVGVVLLSRKMKINPDNVATPIAASLGDLITLALLAAVSTILYSAIGKHHWLAPVIIGVFFSFLPLWVILALKNKYTNDVIYSGWTPVLSAMVISSLGGVILDYGVNKFRGIVVFQPVINGVGGNLVAIQASRISTYLHRRGHPGEMPQGTSRGCTSPFSFFCGKTVNSRAARALMILVIPGHLLFVYTIYYTPAGHTSITIYFITFYLLAALLQVVLLLYISQWMVHFIWGRGGDPDSVAIPYLTAIGDLLGTGFLTLAFYVLYLMGDKDADLGE